MQIVAGLSALTRLEWRPHGQPHRGIDMPRCQELACLRSTSLQGVYITLQQVLGIAWGSAGQLSARPGCLC